MRRFVSLEGYHNPNPLGDANISLEEEALMLDEADQSAAEVNQDLGDAERIVDTAESLEDLAVVAGSKDELSPHEAQLLEKAGDLAVAGSEVDSEEIVPAMESFRVDGKISGKLAAESFKETAQRLWENIKRILKEVWAKIEAFFYKIFGTIPKQRKSLTALKDRVTAANAKTRKNAKFTVAINRYMVTGTTPIKTADAYENALKEFVATGKWVYKDYVDDIKGYGDDIASALDEFDAENPKAATDKLAKALVTSRGKVPGGSPHSGARWPKYTVAKGHDLLGGVSLFQLIPEGAHETNALAILDALRNASTELAPTTEKAKDNSNSVEFTTIGQSEAQAMIKAADELLDVMEQYQRGKVKSEIEATRAKIEKASTKAEGAAAKAKASDEASEKAAVPHYHELIKFNIAYARWVQQPIVPFTKLAFGVVNTTKVLIERSLSQYE